MSKRVTSKAYIDVVETPIMEEDEREHVEDDPESDISESDFSEVTSDEDERHEHVDDLTSSSSSEENTKMKDSLNSIQA